MWFVYFVHAAMFHIVVSISSTFELLCTYADICSEQKKFVDEIEPDYLFEELDRRLENNE